MLKSEQGSEATHSSSMFSIVFLYTEAEPALLPFCHRAERFAGRQHTRDLVGLSWLRCSKVCKAKRHCKHEGTPQQTYIVQGLNDTRKVEHMHMVVMLTNHKIWIQVFSCKAWTVDICRHVVTRINIYACVWPLHFFPLLSSCRGEVGAFWASRDFNREAALARMGVQKLQLGRGCGSSGDLS